MLEKSFNFMTTIEEILNSNVSAGEGQSYISLKAEFAKSIFGNNFQPAETLYYYTLPTTGITSEDELKKALAENVHHKSFMVLEKSVNEMITEMQQAAEATEHFFICPCASLSLEKISKVLAIIYKIKGFDKHEI